MLFGFVGIILLDVAWAMEGGQENTTTYAAVVMASAIGAVAALNKRKEAENKTKEKEVEQGIKHRSEWAGNNVGDTAGSDGVCLMFVNPRRIKWGIEGQRQRREIFEAAMELQADIVGLADVGMTTGTGSAGRYNTGYQCGAFLRDARLCMGRTNDKVCIQLWQSGIQRGKAQDGGLY